LVDEPEQHGKEEILRTLRGLAYYRPKDEEQMVYQAKQQGYVHEQGD